MFQNQQEESQERKNEEEEGIEHSVVEMLEIEVEPKKIERKRYLREQHQKRNTQLKEGMEEFVRERLHECEGIMTESHWELSQFKKQVQTMKDKV